MAREIVGASVQPAVGNVLRSCDKRSRIRIRFSLLFDAFVNQQI